MNSVQDLIAPLHERRAHRNFRCGRVVLATFSLLVGLVIAMQIVAKGNHIAESRQRSVSDPIVALASQYANVEETQQMLHWSRQRLMAGPTRASSIRRAVTWSSIQQVVARNFRALSRHWPLSMVRGKQLGPPAGAPEEFISAIAGRWEPSPGDCSPWMTGMKIAPDGTFECKSGEIRDGLVRVMSLQEREINLKRTCQDANDHVFTIDKDFRRMVGHCIQSGCTYTLTRVDVDPVGQIGGKIPADRVWDVQWSGNPSSSEERVFFNAQTIFAKDRPHSRRTYRLLHFDEEGWRHVSAHTIWKQRSQKSNLS